MSNDLFKDIHDMHTKFGFHESMKTLSPEMLKEYLDFRFRFLIEELTEGQNAIKEGNTEEIVDALIDLIVVAIGTLDVYNVDGQKAWDEVHNANMSKERGIKHNRPNPWNLPDLCKPEGWVGPSHEGNHGLLTKIDFIKE